MLSRIKSKALGANLRHLSTTINGSTNIISENQKARVELAAAYRLLNHYNLNEGVCNHLSMMAPAVSGQGEVMLLIPRGPHWSQVTASCLVGLNEENKVVEGEGKAELSAACIHRGIHTARPDAKCVMHTHMPYATAIACLMDPTVLMIHQTSARFYGNVAYDLAYSGLADAIDEGERLGKKLGKNLVLSMANHGILVAAANVSLAFDTTYYLERTCMTQVLAMSTGHEPRILSDEIARKSYQQTYHPANEEHAIQYYADAHFYALIRKLEKEEPDFKD